MWRLCIDWLDRMLQDTNNDPNRKIQIQNLEHLIFAAAVAVFDTTISAA